MPSRSDPPAGDIVQRTEGTLRHAQVELRELLLSVDPELYAAHFRNVIVHGRSVTFVLQQLRSRVHGFDAWYEPWQQEMKEDALLRYFVDVRNDILKKGDTHAGANLYIRSLSTDQIGPSPEGAKSLFIGDHLGGIGWDVDRGDGTAGKVYWKLPREVGEVWYTFRDAPLIHLGKDITGLSAAHLLDLYLKYLARLVGEARRTFGVA